MDLLTHFSVEKINAIGFSYGGEILFQLALLKPDVIGSMVIIGSCGTWNANDFPEFLEFMTYENIGQMPWMHEQQQSEERIKNIIEQLPNYSISLTNEELKSIKARTLLIVGDNDAWTPLECILKAKSHIPESYLWVVPNTEHNILRENKDLFLRITNDFLSQKKW